MKCNHFHLYSSNKEKLKKMEEKITTKRPKKIRAYIRGLVFITVGVVISLYRLFDISLSKLLPITLIAVGIILILTYLYHHKKTES